MTDPTNIEDLPLCECGLRSCGFHHAKHGYSCGKNATTMMHDPVLTQHAGVAVCDDCKYAHDRAGFKKASRR